MWCHRVHNLPLCTKHLVLLCCVFLIPACATLTATEHTAAIPSLDNTTITTPQSSPPTSTPTSPPTSDRGWWNIRFIIDWPEQAEASWNVDLYLADKIIKPVLDQYRDKLELWRFHRRAARDAAGHRFSFSFYSTGEVAQLIATAIRNDQQLAIVQSEGVIKEVQYPDTNVNHAAQIADTSDKAWSGPVKNAWPYYIMGVCEMWLRLVDEIAVRDIANQEINSYQDILQYYRHVDDEVSEIWRDEGGHAFLHHLNALFGYKQTIVIERRYMQF